MRSAPESCGAVGALRRTPAEQSSAKEQARPAYHTLRRQHRNHHNNQREGAATLRPRCKQIPPNRQPLSNNAGRRQPGARQRRNEADRDLRKTEGRNTTTTSRVSFLFILWVLLSTNALWVYPHHTTYPPKNTSITYSSIHHPSMLPPSPSTLSWQHSPHPLSGGHSTLTPQNICYPLKSTIYHLVLHPRTTPAPRSTRPPSPPTTHHTTRTGVSKTSCTYHTINTTIKKIQKPSIIPPKNLPPQFQITLSHTAEVDQKSRRPPTACTHKFEDEQVTQHPPVALPLHTATLPLHTAALPLHTATDRHPHHLLQPAHPAHPRTSAKTTKPSKLPLIQTHRQSQQKVNLNLRGNKTSDPTQTANSSKPPPTQTHYQHHIKVDPKLINNKNFEDIPLITLRSYTLRHPNLNRYAQAPTHDQAKDKKTTTKRRKFTPKTATTHLETQTTDPPSSQADLRMHLTHQKIHHPHPPSSLQIPHPQTNSLISFSPSHTFISLSLNSTTSHSLPHSLISLSLGNIATSHLPPHSLTPLHTTSSHPLFHSLPSLSITTHHPLSHSCILLPPPNTITSHPPPHSLIPLSPLKTTTYHLLPQLLLLLPLSRPSTPHPPSHSYTLPSPSSSSTGDVRMTPSTRAATGNKFSVIRSLEAEHQHSLAMQGPKKVPSDIVRREGSRATSKGGPTPKEPD
jgi:hypothetical protein